MNKEHPIRINRKWNQKSWYNFVIYSIWSILHTFNSIFKYLTEFTFNRISKKKKLFEANKELCFFFCCGKTYYNVLQCIAWRTKQKIKKQINDLNWLDSRTKFNTYYKKKFACYKTKKLHRIENTKTKAEKKDLTLNYSNLLTLTLYGLFTKKSAKNCIFL